jgi:hypothetical protein
MTSSPSVTAHVASGGESVSAQRSQLSAQRACMAARLETHSPAATRAAHGSLFKGEAQA